MTQLHNIFSRRKSKIKKQLPKQRILVDHREKNSLVPSSLINLGLEVEFKQLKVADYITRGVAIERKTVSDFISSMINKRLPKQLEEMQQYERRLLIIEGIEEQELYSETNAGINPNAIRGFLLSILLRYNVPVVFSKNQKDTAIYISLIAKKKKTEQSFQVTKRNLTKKEQMQFIVESFKGIGPKNAQKLLKKFGTLRNIFNASQEQLRELLGKKSEVFNILEDKY
jgi:Fanconi anemia group M protein